jgi:hypothetical protein
MDDREGPFTIGYASPGTGTQPHLVGELFKLSLKLDLVGGLAVGNSLPTSDSDRTWPRRVSRQQVE